MTKQIPSEIVSKVIKNNVKMAPKLGANTIFDHGYLSIEKVNLFRPQYLISGNANTIFDHRYLAIGKVNLFRPQYLILGNASTIFDHIISSPRKR